MRFCRQLLDASKRSAILSSIRAKFSTKFDEILRCSKKSQILSGINLGCSLVSLGCVCDALACSKLVRSFSRKPGCRFTGCTTFGIRTSGLLIGPATIYEKLRWISIFEKPFEVILPYVSENRQQISVKFCRQLVDDSKRSVNFEFYSGKVFN